MRPSDSIHDPRQLELLRTHARKALEKAGALGRLPTPVADVMLAAHLEVAEEALDHNLLDYLRKTSRRAGATLKKALSKVWGVLDAKAGLVYVDKAVLVVKQRFLKLHEAAHAVLPWQRNLYGVIEDCEKTLSPEVSERFDREANAFASEVLFQLDAFTREANEKPFGIKVPLALSRRYGASAYASVRRYVSRSARPCVVLVLEPPVLKEGDGFVAVLRREVSSSEFDRVFGKQAWPKEFTSNDRIGALIPIGKKMTFPREVPLTDLSGTVHQCLAEGFATPHHVFVLIHAVSALTARSIVVP